jgi:hypothetical protein
MIERELLALRDEIAWPATPDLAASVSARIAAEPRPRARRAWWPTPRLAPALAAVLVVLVAFGILLAASSGVRATLRDWLGIGSVHITRVERLPNVAPGRQLELGRRADVAAANRHLGSPIATVRALGAPDAIYLGDEQPGRVSLVYLARPGLPAGTAGVGALLDQLQGDAMIFVEKLVAGNIPITRVTVNGAPGYFVGGPHTVNLPDPLRPRIAGNTLVWVRDAVTYRLETGLGLDEALSLARSVR